MVQTTARQGEAAGRAASGAHSRAASPSETRKCPAPTGTSVEMTPLLEYTLRMWQEQPGLMHNFQS